MTPDDLRTRLQDVLDDAAKVKGEVPCPICHGTGKVQRSVRSITQTDVAEAIGTTRPSVSSFLKGRQTFGMEVTLRLIDWLDQQIVARYSGSGIEGSVT